MTRVQGVVGTTIKVHIHDIVVGDVLHTSGTERDPIIERIERDGDQVRLHYKDNGGDRPSDSVRESMWMDPNLGGYVFLHDLNRERFEFLVQEEVSV